MQLFVCAYKFLYHHLEHNVSQSQSTSICLKMCWNEEVKVALRPRPTTGCVRCKHGHLRMIGSLGAHEKSPTPV